MSISSVQEKKWANKKCLPAFPVKDCSSVGRKVDENAFPPLFWTVLLKAQTNPHPMAPRGVGCPGQGRTLAQSDNVCLQSHHSMHPVPSHRSHPCWFIASLSRQFPPSPPAIPLTGSLPAPITLLHIWVLSVPAVSFFETIQPQHNELKAIFSWRLSQKSLKDTPVLHNICCLPCTAMWKE